jgi:chemotaxis protein CheX
MTDINTLDVKSFIINAVNDVFDTMLSMKVDFFEAEHPPEFKNRRIVGSVSFAGEITGVFYIQVEFAVAQGYTASILGMELEEVEGDEEVKDVMGELSNMIGGNLKSRFCDAGLDCVLSIPSIILGKDFTFASVKGGRHDKVFFRNGQDVAVVDVFIKL